MGGSFLGRQLAKLVMASLSMTAADTAAPRPTWGGWTRWGDQHDGSYRNPILPADFSDLDVIRLGGTYYAIASTLHMSPGMVVLRSTDLVNWQTIGHVVPDLTRIGPAYRWDRMGRFGRGVWAGTIRYHAGRFYVYFGTPDEGFFMSSARDPAGPWSPLRTILAGAGWDDCSVLWDDDGKAYFIGTHFADGYKTYLFRMSADGRSIDRASATLVHEGHGGEANKLLRKDGWYYIIYSEHRDGIGRYVMARRSRSAMGSYGPAKQIAAVNADANEPNQGGIVEGPRGGWYFLTHHGTGAWEGRAASLLPVLWRGGWPLIGDRAGDPPGAMVWHAPKPVESAAPAGPALSDRFAAPTLAPQWEWNHQPRDDHWSLTERPGWLRLHAWRPLVAQDLRTAGNVVSQRSFRTPANRVTVRLDVTGMADAQHAGLANVSTAYAGIGVVQQGTSRAIEYRTVEGGRSVAPLVQPIVWLRAEWGSDGVARYGYSLDGVRFVAAGDPYRMTYGNGRGDRISLFTYNDRGDRGIVDIDDFDYRIDGPG